MDDERKRDIRDVMQEEGSRGRRRVDIETRRKQAQDLKDMRKLLENPTEKDFLDAMRAGGVEVDPQRLEEMLRIWREFRS
jgi:hypothetical protein